MKVKLMKTCGWYIVIALLIMSLVGCGGSGGTGAVSGTKGVAAIKITWPARSRVIPLAANSITCSLRLNGVTVQSIVTPRPSGTTQSAVQFQGLVPGTYDVFAYATPNADGTGVSQAEGSTSIVITAGNITNFQLTMSSTVTSLTVRSSTATFKVGETASLSVTAFSMVKWYLSIHPN